MARYAKNRTPKGPRAVEKVELQTDHLKLRIAAAVFFLILGASALAYGFTKLINGDAGWREINVSTAEANCAVDFTLMYDVGSGGSVHNEARAVTEVYSQASVEAYRLFNAYEEFEGAINLGYMNAHPNEEISVDGALYSALEKYSESGDRTAYLGPAYSVYDDLFYMQSPDGAYDFDPILNPEIGGLFAEIAGFACDKNSVDVVLLGGGKLMLRVSEEYLSFLRENEFSVIFDFFWLKNAFVADYIAEKLSGEGLTNGLISSFDGYVRNLDARGGEFGLSILRNSGGRVFSDAELRYVGPCAFVQFRSFPCVSGDERRFVTLTDGSVRGPYLSPSSGRPVCALSELTAWSPDLGCADIALALSPIYLAESLDKAALDSVGGVEYIYFDGDKAVCSDREAKIE